MLGAVNRLKSYDLTLDPYHWDGFGGYRCCGLFAVKWCTLFFAGSSFFRRPSRSSPMRGPPIMCVSWGFALPTLFIAFGIIGFVHSQVLVHRIVRDEKMKEDAVPKGRAGRGLLRLREHGLEAAALRRERFEALEDFTDFFYQRVGRVREWPFDYSVILQLIASALVPIIMAGVEITRLRGKIP